jgi:hypothetical protein
LKSVDNIDESIEIDEGSVCIDDSDIIDSSDILPEARRIKEPIDYTQVGEDLEDEVYIFLVLKIIKRNKINKTSYIFYLLLYKVIICINFLFVVRSPGKLP